MTVSVQTLSLPLGLPLSTSRPYSVSFALKYVLSFMSARLLGRKQGSFNVLIVHLLKQV